MRNNCGSCDYANHLAKNDETNVFWCDNYKVSVNYDSFGCDKYSYYGREHGRFLVTAVCDILNLNLEQAKFITSSFDMVVYDRIPQNEYLYDYIRQYDAIGPAIADRLRKDSFKETIADSMLYEYILPACNNIHDGDYEYGISMYAQMAEKLFDYYFATDSKESFVRKR